MLIFLLLLQRTISTNAESEILRFGSYEEFNIALNENNIVTANHYVILDESKEFSKNSE